MVSAPFAHHNNLTLNLTNMNKLFLISAVALSTLASAQVPSADSFLDFEYLENGFMQSLEESTLFYLPEEQMYIRIYEHTTVGIGTAHRQFLEDVGSNRVEDASIIPSWLDVTNYRLVDALSEDGDVQLEMKSNVGKCRMTLLVARETVLIAYTYKEL